MMKLNLDATFIIKLLPQRFPMLMVDCVKKYQKNRILTQKNITINEPFFQGHFPEYPVFPGIYMIEMVGQSCQIMMALNSLDFKDTLDLTEQLNNQVVTKFNQPGYLAGIKNVKYVLPAYPGDSLFAEVKLKSNSLRIAESVFKITNQDKKTICEGKMLVTRQ